MSFKRILRQRGQEAAAQEKEVKISHGVGDAGFSLVEVIISMVILAIIAIPLLSYFSTSTKYNALMAKEQKATALAQEVAEDLKEQGTLIEERSTEEKGGTDDPNQTDYKSTVLTDMNYTLTSSTKADADGNNWELVYDGYADLIGENYDVRVTLTDTADNAQTVYEIPSVNNKTDVFATEGSQFDEAVSYFMSENALYCESENQKYYEWQASGGIGAAPRYCTPMEEDEIEELLQRTITVVLQNDEGDTSYHVTVKCSYTCLDAIDGVDEGETYDASDFEDVYISYDYIGKVFIMFNANMMNSDDTSVNDNIIIENRLSLLDDADGNNKPDIILVCQNKDEANANNGYRIEVGGRTTDDETANASTLFSIIGNLRSNIRLYRYGETGVQITGVQSGSDYAGSGAEVYYELTDLDEEVRRVDVEVSVYKKGTLGHSDEHLYLTVDATYDT